jgi:hypothetical protein
MKKLTEQEARHVSSLLTERFQDRHKPICKCFKIGFEFAPNHVFYNRKEKQRHEARNPKLHYRG